MCSNFQKMEIDDDDDLSLIAEVERIETEYSKKEKTDLHHRADNRKVVIIDLPNTSKTSIDKRISENESSGNIMDWFKPVTNSGDSDSKSRIVVTEPFTNSSVSILITPAIPELRKYQRDIIITAVMHNTLVCLPTGLGKTLIAAVVMYNFLRWFPGKIVVFMAPTRPLVHQQWQVRRFRCSLSRWPNVSRL